MVINLLGSALQVASAAVLVSRLGAVGAPLAMTGCEIVQVGQAHRPEAFNQKPRQEVHTLTSWPDIRAERPP